MNTSALKFISLACLGLAGVTAEAKPKEWPQYGVEASIPFANSGGIHNFEPNEARGLWIEDRQRRWYYARIAGQCSNLRYANNIGFDTRGTSTFDKFSAVIVDGDYCLLESLVTAEKPLPRKQRLKLRKEVREEGRKAVAPKD